jgi:NCS1 family nucleobase:cation symporter-1
MAMPMASAWTPFRPRLGVRRVRAADPKAASAGAAPRADRGIGATMRRISAWSVFRGSLRHRAGPRLAPGAIRSAAAAFQPERRAIREKRERVALGDLSGTPLRGSHSARGADASWVPAAAGARGFDARAFFAFDVDDATGDETTARGDPVDPALALPRVPVTLGGDTAWAYWVCAAVAAALFAEPMGFARWGLSTIAPLVWWQVAASTAAGTLMASPYLLALANPAVSYRLSFPALARVAFGVQGARLVIALRAVLGLALTALTALAGGAATYRLWGEVSYVFFDGAPLPSWAPAAAYALFWLAQLAFASGKSQAKKVRALGRLAAVTAAAYAAWSWNAGDAATVWTATARAVQSVSAGAGGGLAGAGAALAPALEPEFWRHALMVCGTWMTLGTVVPDYAQRMTTPKSVTLGVLVVLPAFAAAAALVGSSLAQAPNLALYSALLVACLVTNAATNVVGPMTWVKQGAGRRLSSGAAATIVTSIAAVAAYAVLPWQTVVAYASWAVGAGALFVAPAAGVMVADYWVCRDRVVDRDALQTAAATGAYAYAGGTNYRAVAALFAGMAPELWSFASNIAADLAARNAGPLTLQSVMDSVRALLGWFVFNSEYSAVIAAATAFVAYVSLTVMFVPESLKVARAEAAALSADERAARERARVAAAEAAANAEEMAKYVDGAAAATANDARRAAPSPSPRRPSTRRTSCPARSSGRRRRRRSWSPR